MQEQKPTYEALAEANTSLQKENADLKALISNQSLEITELKAKLDELLRLTYDTKSESRGSNYTPAKKKRKKK